MAGDYAWAEDSTSSSAADRKEGDYLHLQKGNIR